MTETTRITVSEVIHRQVEEVFAFYVDVANFARWSESIESVVRDAEGDLEVGETFKVFITVMGKRMEVDHEVVALERDRRFAYRVRWPIPCTWDVTFEPVPDGTRFCVTLAMNMAESAGVFEKTPPASFFHAKEHASMMALKAILEGSAPNDR